MFEKAQRQHQPQPKFRRLMGFMVLVTLLSLTMLLWTHSRSERTFQLWTQAESPRQPQTRKKPTIPLQCGPGLIAAEGDKVAVNGTKTVLLSAYQEHRTDRKEVRVISVALRSETVSYYCFLCCSDQLHVSEGFSGIHSDHFGFAYGTADIMCPIPSGCESPSHIAVTSATSESEDNPENTFLEVKNQQGESDSFPYNFTVCFSTMYDFSNVLQLVQSLEILQILGVNRVVVYQISCSPETQRVLDYYTLKGLVEVIPWSMSRFLNVSRGWLPQHGPGDLHYFGQTAALTDCVYRYMYRTRYMALHDIDELILPQSVNSWNELLPQLEMHYGADVGYAFYNFVFPTSISLPAPSSETLTPQSRCCPSWQYVPGVNILAHLYREPDFDETSINYKIIVNPRIVFTPTVHGLLKPARSCTAVHRDIARMYHTREPKQTKVTYDRLIYDGRLLSIGANFTSAVTAVLTESGLLPEDAVQ
ncbi:uncharacterized protein V6R79_013581 [Siganus canaliculatus]